MSIGSNVAAPGLLRERALSVPDAVVQWPKIPLPVKFITMIFLSLIVSVLSVLAVARTSTIPEIWSVPESYLPGNSLPVLPQYASCFEAEYLYRTCIVHLSSHTIYLSFEPNSRQIIHAVMPARNYKIGELVIAWGDPTGITQYSGSVFVYWGTRSAVLYTHSFRPENRVEFIRYDFQEQQASTWRGFKPF